MEDLIPDRILTCNFLLGITLLEASLYWKLSVCSSNRVCDESEHLGMDFVDELGVRKDASYAHAGEENPEEAGGGARTWGAHWEAVYQAGRADLYDLSQVLSKR